MRMRNPYLGLLAIATSLLAACASAPRDYGTATTYTCPNGTQFGAQFSRDNEAMQLSLDGKTHTLMRVVSASGARYADKTYTFWEKDGEAALGTTDNLLGQACRDATKQASTMSTLSGTVNYKVRSALPPSARLEVKLQDVSLADAPAVTLGEFKRDNPGQVPIPFALQYDSRQLKQGHTYAVSAAIYEGDKLLFINDTQHRVLDGDPAAQGPVNIEVILVSR